LPVRVPVTSVLQSVRQQLAQEAAAAAGNALLSRTEQDQLGEGVLKEAAEALRTEGGPGTRVSTEALVDKALDRVAALLGGVNQGSGPGAFIVSQAEVQTLATTHRDAGVRVARAYELITGKKIDLPGSAGPAPVDPVLPAPAPAPGAVLGETGPIVAAFDTLLGLVAAPYAGANGVFSQAERRAVPPGVLRDALDATTAAVRVRDAGELVRTALEPLLVAAGIDARAVDPSAPFLRGALEALLAVHPEAAGLFADAVWMARGARPDLAGLPATRVPQDAAPIQNTGAAPTDGAFFIAEAHSGGGTRLSFDGGDLVVSTEPATTPTRRISFTVDSVHVDLTLSNEQFNARAAVEAIRAALPHHDVVTMSADPNALKLRIYPKGQGVRPAGFPNYAHFQNPAPAQWGHGSSSRMGGFIRRMHGTKSFELSMENSDRALPLRVVVDHKVYLVEKSARIQTDYQAVRELKRQLESDGVQLDYNEWGGPGPYGLGVVKFKLL
jgi:hypothetical protein